MMKQGELNRAQNKKLAELSKRLDKAEQAWEASPANPNGTVIVNSDDLRATIDAANEANKRKIAQIDGGYMPLTRREKAQRRF
jgi:histidinol-phosphate/aromatic aminotransferase/cobyric acid decarboxylase-like protein